jgi:hypothetical protein
MANVTIVVTDAQAAALPLRRDGAGRAETVTQFCQRNIDSVASVAMNQKRQQDFDSFNDTRKDVIIAAEKAR